ncbi:pyridoxamine 5'-phosphate oxidase family protein [Glaciihabitans sp. INWT7]|uniref:pyridoxamine 5'-phosphate oxidase family protein n=1 Tax=Glaciihabitans sp. INWT7 TaxID=2596912 RepID=UPI0016266020|nr:pyridoxamine 5'-phosphate oxidase family protein [Glaciihabitans sp. INWT7]QNE45557.1 pyridoxamine 5'-phosphate oxidase family protein [Glaciihabitans sp. INWT7]
MTANQEEIATVAELIKASRIALLTTINNHGQLTSRPLAVQEVEFDGDLWFFSQDPSDKTTEIAANAQVNVSLESGKGYVSIAGTAEIVHDAAKVDELWSKRVEAWFPEGKEDPSIALIKVHADSAEYWSTDDPKPVIFFKVAKAAVTGGQPDIGENKTVDL